MHKTMLTLYLGIVIVFALAGCGEHGPPPKDGGQKQRIALPKATLQQPVGEAAITPTTSGIPAFTKDDVAKYIKTHTMPFSDTPPSAITGIEVTFAASKEVNGVINRQNTGFPDDYLLCLVRLTGTFTFPGPPPTNGEPSSGTYQQAYEVFDAKTGNLLMGGALGNNAGTIG